VYEFEFVIYEGDVFRWQKYEGQRSLSGNKAKHMIDGLCLSEEPQWAPEVYSFLGYFVRCCKR
jgi:hypothetical protein